MERKKKRRKKKKIGVSESNIDISGAHTWPDNSSGGSYSQIKKRESERAKERQKCEERHGTEGRKKCNVVHNCTFSLLLVKRGLSIHLFPNNQEKKMRGSLKYYFQFTQCVI